MQNIEEIYKEYCNTIYKYLVCLTHNEEIAEDLTQETFAIAVKEINKFRGECKVSVWLCQIAKHLWWKQLKKDKTNKNISFEELTIDLESLDNTEETIYENEEKIKFLKSLQKLDSISKDVVYLRIMGNLSFIEIGEILDKTPNWARVTFYRAKQKIKEVNKNGEND